MQNKLPTPPSTLVEARNIAQKNGVHYAYTGNVINENGSSTRCHTCGELLIGRMQYNLTRWNLDAGGHCNHCGAACAGVFEAKPGDWGSRRLPVRLADFTRPA
jgi:pyruvate formate lyase activating enzyme